MYIAVAEGIHTVVRFVANAMYLQLSGALNCDIRTIIVAELCFVLRFIQYGRYVTINVQQVMKLER